MLFAVTDGFTGSNNLWINLLWGVGAVLVVLAAVGFAAAYIWAQFKKTKGGIDSQNRVIVDDTIKDYQNRINALEETVKTLTETSQCNAQEIEKLKAQNTEQAIQLDTFKDYPLDWQETSKIIADHMEKSNKLLDKLFKRLDKIEAVNYAAEKLKAEQLLASNRLLAEQKLAAESLSAKQLVDKQR